MLSTVSFALKSSRQALLRLGRLWPRLLVLLRFRGDLTPPAKPSTPPPTEFVLPPVPPPLPPLAEGSPLRNTDVDTNCVENGDDGSKRLRVDASVGQSVPDASTLSKALRESNTCRTKLVGKVPRGTTGGARRCCSLEIGRIGMKRCFSEQNAGLILVVKKGSKKMFFEEFCWEFEAKRSF